MYETMRARLLNKYDIPPATRLRNIVKSGGMGDRTPSRLLRDMREVYLTDMTDTVLEQFLYAKLLLPAVRSIVVGLTGSLDTLAERADRIWESFASPEIAAMSTVYEIVSRQVFRLFLIRSVWRTIKADPVTTRTSVGSRFQCATTK